MILWGRLSLTWSHCITSNFIAERFSFGRTIINAEFDNLTFIRPETWCQTLVANRNRTFIWKSLRCCFRLWMRVLSWQHFSTTAHKYRRSNITHSLKVMTKTLVSRSFAECCCCRHQNKRRGLSVITWITLTSDSRRWTHEDIHHKIVKLLISLLIMSCLCVPMNIYTKKDNTPCLQCRDGGSKWRHLWWLCRTPRPYLQIILNTNEWD